MSRLSLTELEDKDVNYLIGYNVVELTKEEVQYLSREVEELNEEFDQARLRMVPGLVDGAEIIEFGKDDLEDLFNE